MKKSIRSDRRIKIAMVDPALLLSIANSWKFARSSQTIRLPCIRIPDRTKVLSVSFDPAYQAFRFVLQNDSWPECPVDQQPESLLIHTKSVEFKLIHATTEADL